MRRELNSLTWDASLEAPPAAPVPRKDSGFLDGFRQASCRAWQPARPQGFCLRVGRWPAP